MSERRSSIVVGEKPEALLGSLALPERDWEALALAVEARLLDSAAGSSDAALLAAPLPVEAGEPESASVTPLASSGVRTQSLAELARQSLSKGGESDASIAKASLALAARGRAQTEELAERLRQSQATAAHDDAPVDVTDSVQAEDDAPAAAALAPARPALSGNQLGYWVGAGGALLALAAVFALWRRPAPAPLVVTQVIEQKADKSAASPAAATADEPKAVEPAALARENAAPAPAAVSAPAALALANARAPAPAVAAPASAAGSAGPAPDKIVLEDDTPNAPVAKADPVASADKPGTNAAAAAGSEPQMRPADNTAAGSLPAKPSMGALQSAMAGVMSSARHCVAGESEPSSALVVFGSDGHVSSVTVSGAAAGKPAAACIQAALSRAKTQPFAESSFSFSTTVRP